MIGQQFFEVFFPPSTRGFTTFLLGSVFHFARCCCFNLNSWICIRTFQPCSVIQWRFLVLSQTRVPRLFVCTPDSSLASAVSSSSHLGSSTPSLSPSITSSSSESSDFFPSEDDHPMLSSPLLVPTIFPVDPDSRMILFLIRLSIFLLPGSLLIPYRSNILRRFLLTQLTGTLRLVIRFRLR